MVEQKKQKVDDYLGRDCSKLVASRNSQEASGQMEQRNDANTLTPPCGHRRNSSLWARNSCRDPQFIPLFVHVFRRPVVLFTLCNRIDLVFSTVCTPASCELATRESAQLALRVMCNQAGSGLWIGSHLALHRGFPASAS